MLGGRGIGVSQFPNGEGLRGVAGWAEDMRRGTIAAMLWKSRTHDAGYDRGFLHDGNRIPEQFHRDWKRLHLSFRAKRSDLVRLIARPMRTFERDCFVGPVIFSPLIGKFRLVRRGGA